MQIAFKTLSWITIFCLATISLSAQPTYPALTNNITFTELVSHAIVREMEWINPNGVTEKIKITEMTIPVDEKSTRDFLIANYNLDSIWLTPRMIVFHAMGDGTLQNSLEVSSFLNNQIPTSWGTLYKAGRLPNGAHFIVEKNGNIICLTPPVSSDGSRISYERNNHKWFIKRHQDGNPVAIGIENVTDQGNFTSLTNDQIESNARLARWLIWMENFKIEYLTSHHQFNSDKNYAVFLSTFGIKHLREQYRTKGRKDIGDQNLHEIIRNVNGYGYSIQSFFDPR